MRGWDYAWIRVTTGRWRSSDLRIKAGATRRLETVRRVRNGSASRVALCKRDTARHLISAENPWRTDLQFQCPSKAEHEKQR